MRALQLQALGAALYGFTIVLTNTSSDWIL